MKRLVLFALLLGLAGGALPAHAEETGSPIFAFGKRARVHYVVYAAPVFDGTGYASQGFLRYAPYRPDFSARVHPDRSNYYQMVFELP